MGASRVVSGILIGMFLFVAFPSHTFASVSMGESAFSQWVRVSSGTSYGGKMNDSGGMTKNMKKKMNSMGEMKKTGMASMKNNIFSTGGMNTMGLLNFIDTDDGMGKMEKTKKISPLRISSIVKKTDMNDMSAKTTIKRGMYSEMKEKMPKKMKKKMTKRMNNENMEPEPMGEKAEEMEEEKMEDVKKDEDIGGEEAMPIEPEAHKPEKTD